jgi:hypothetical protein
MTTTQLAPSQARHYLTDSASTQIKMFVHSNPIDAEKAIGEWLQENDVRIHHIAQSQSEKGGKFVFVITLFYLTND